MLVGSDTPGKPPKSQTKFIFNGDNVHGRATVERDRRISINKSILPPDCVEVIWKAKSGNPLSQPGDLLLLAKRLRSSLNLPPPQEFEAVKQTPTPKPPTLPVKSTPPTVPAKVTPTPVPETTPDNAPDWEGQDLSLLEKLKEYPECQKWGMGILSRMLQGMKPQEIFESPTMQKENTTLERVTAYNNILFTLLYPKDGRVIPEHFRIAPSEYEWPNDMTIWSAGGQDVWTLDDVTQGTLILGATGSGKSTCSGRTLAKAMLAKQFGGMILTTKPGEGREWGMFCDSVNRQDQVRWIRLGGPLKLNLLAYETQRLGAGAHLTENLVGFFRVLLSVMGQRHGQRANEGFWQNAGNQLLRNLLDVFLISKSPLSLDRLADFVSAAPTKKLDDDEAWREIPLFGDVLATAQSNATDPKDQRAFEKAKSYWLVDYPTLAPETRSCVTFGFKAMLDVLRSREIYELLCSETSITPDCTFNGHIMILDIPVKDYGDAGVLVQCAFKYLFQRAVERRKDMGNQTRPVFLFIDEAQNFFTEYDTVFQQTARSSRVATVLLSQNVNNFYAHLGGDHNARYLFDSLAGNLNTKIFHANGDTLTNEWASKMLGTWDRPVTSSSASSHTSQSINPFDNEPPTIGHGVTTRREPMVFPDEFARLRSGNSKNGFHAEAYVYRVGSVFEQTGQAFIKTAFQQIQFKEAPPRL